MKKDIKYIIKRILIGVGIALAIMFIKQNVYAFEWTTTGDEYIYNSNPVSLEYSYISYYSRSGISYPYSQTSTLNNLNLTCSSTTIDEISYCLGGGGGDSGFTSNIYGPYEYTGLRYVFNTTLSPGNYYVILPGAYNNILNSNYVTNFNYNDDLLLDSSTYSVNTDKINIKSALFSSNVENTLNSSSIWNKIFYFKIYFEVSEEVSNFQFLIGNVSSQTGILTSFNVSTFNNYLYKYSFTENNNNINTLYSYRFFQPMFYSHIPGSIEPDDITIPDYYDDVKSDIEGIIGDINDDIYSQDNSINNIFGGGNGGLNFGNYNFSEVLTMPLRFLQTLMNDTTCQPININIPINNASISIPCFDTFFTDIFGSNLLSVIQLIIIGSISLYLMFDLYDFIMKIADPTGLLYYEENIEYLNNRTGEVVSKKRRNVK